MHYALDTQQEEDDENSPPVELMRMTRALADPSRVQLLKLITQAPKSFTEVVNISNLSKGTVHHHMMMLRAAGLIHIHIHIHGNQERFSYRREGILDLKGFLEFYLG
jgi:DNA-binding transcriptional ArsR family regulator